MKTIILAIALMSGCASGILVDYLPNQAQALQGLADTYRMDVHEIPPIAWIVGDRLNCAGLYGPGWRDGRYCVDGQFQEDSLFGGPALIKVAIIPGASWGNNALAHEVCHVYAKDHWGDSDQSHYGPCFNNPGEHGEQTHGMTYLGNNALAALGVAWNGN